MNLTRRTFLTTAVAATVATSLPAKAQMTSSTAIPASTALTPPPCMWQDLARTIPAVKEGDVVMVIDAIDGPPMVASSVASAPTISKHKTGSMCLVFEGGPEDFDTLEFQPKPFNVMKHDKPFSFSKFAISETSLPTRLRTFKLEDLFANGQSGMLWEVGKPLQYFGDCT